jgi:hypothetical protein
MTAETKDNEHEEEPPQKERKKNCDVIPIRSLHTMMQVITQTFSHIIPIIVH